MLVIYFQMLLSWIILAVYHAIFWSEIHILQISYHSTLTHIDL